MVKLPTFVIKTFSGDPTEWESFYQSFNEAIDKETELANIEKINYLIGYIKGEALNCVKGLSLSNEIIQL